MRLFSLGPVVLGVVGVFLAGGARCICPGSVSMLFRWFPGGLSGVLCSGLLSRYRPFSDLAVSVMVTVPATCAQLFVPVPIAVRAMVMLF